MFLGLDKGDIWTHDTYVKDPVPLSMPIDIPENAVRAVFRFNHVDTKASGFYAWAGKIATFMVLMLLFSWMKTSFGF